MSQRTEYLGDGVYVEFRDDEIVLYTSNGIERLNEIYLQLDQALELAKLTGEVYVR